MVPVNEGHVEASTFTKEPRQDRLGLFGIVINQVCHPRSAQSLKSAVSESTLLMGIDDHVPPVRTAGSQKTLADVQRGNRVTEPDFDGVYSALSDHTVAESPSLREADGDREEVVDRPITRGNGRGFMC